MRDMKEEWKYQVAERIKTILATRPDKVIYNPPATIVLWADGTKTVVKAHDEPYDAEKGFLLCLAKKVWGESFHYTMKECVFTTGRNLVSNPNNLMSIKYTFK